MFEAKHEINYERKKKNEFKLQSLSLEVDVRVHTRVFNCRPIDWGEAFKLLEWNIVAQCSPQPTEV